MVQRSATKVTLTLPADLLTVVDRFVDEHPGTTRSGLCAEALRDWLRAAQEAEIAAYYGGMSDDERREDAEWAAAAARSAALLYR